MSLITLLIVIVLVVVIIAAIGLASPPLSPRMVRILQVVFLILFLLWLLGAVGGWGPTIRVGLAAVPLTMFAMVGVPPRPPPKRLAPLPPRVPALPDGVDTSPDPPPPESPPTATGDPPTLPSMAELDAPTRARLNDAIARAIAAELGRVKVTSVPPESEAPRSSIRAAADVAGNVGGKLGKWAVYATSALSIIGTVISWWRPEYAAPLGQALKLIAGVINAAAGGGPPSGDVAP